MTAPVAGDGAREGESGGSASVEAALIIGALLLMLGFAIAGGRLVAAESAADHAARAAVRVASLQRSAGAAEWAARTAADQSLATQDLHCRPLTVDIDTGALDGPIGVPAAVTVTVRCGVAWSDLGLPADTPGPVVESTAVSTVDRWRERA